MSQTRVTVKDQNVAVVKISDGFIGPPGRPATLEVGTVTTGAAGTNAIITNSGDQFDAVFDFVIPKGDQGDAASLNLGTVTVANPDQNPSITNSGTSSDAVFDFVLPRAASVSVSAATVLNPDQSPSVSDSGTDGDVVLGFSLPRAADVSVTTPATVLNPDQNPTVADTGTDGDVVLGFGLPRAATLDLGTITVVNPDQNPDITEVGLNGDKVFNFVLPRAATLSVGQVTSVNPDQSPAVTDVGTNGDSVFDFDLPRAPTFAVGTVTPVAAGDPPTITDVGTNGDIVLDFGLPQGDAATIAVGTTTAVNPDVSPSVTNSGTTSDAILDFDLPRAPTFTVGTVTTGAAGTNASITDIGTDGDIELDFTIPRGDKGDKGDKGDQGDAATLDLGTVTVANPDQNPSITNSGTTSDAVFDFVIPRAAAISIGTVTTVEFDEAATVTNVGTDGDVILDFDIPRGTIGVDGAPGIVIDDTEPTNFDVLWADTSEPGVNVLPSGGTTGQYLIKSSNADFDAEWITTTFLEDTDVIDNLTSDDIDKPLSAAQGKELKSQLDGLLAASDAMIFKGTLGSGGTFTALPTTHDIGWTIKVITAGTYAGKVAEIGDMYVSLVSREGAGNQDSDWAVIQANIDGAVTGPASSVANNIAVFNNTSGKVIADGGKALPTGTIVGTTDTQTLENKTLTSPVINSPTGITNSDVGLGNVPNLNTTDAVNKAHSQNTDTKLDEGGANEVTAAEARDHIDATDNPHSVTKAQVGLGNVQNVDQTNADNLTSGTVPSARISGNYTGIDRTAAVFSHPTDTGSVNNTHQRAVMASDNSRASGGTSAVVGSALSTASGGSSAVVASRNAVAAGERGSAISAFSSSANGNQSSVIAVFDCQANADRCLVIGGRGVSNTVNDSLALGFATSASSTANRKIHLFSANGNIYNDGELRFGNLNWSTDVPTGGWALDNSGGNLRVRDGTTERMRITSDGEVGIKVTNPVTDLQLGQSAPASAEQINSSYIAGQYNLGVHRRVNAGQTLEIDLIIPAITYFDFLVTGAGNAGFATDRNAARQHRFRAFTNGTSFLLEDFSEVYNETLSASSRFGAFTCTLPGGNILRFTFPNTSTIRDFGVPSIYHISGTCTGAIELDAIRVI